MSEAPDIGHNLPPREQQIRDNIFERHSHLKPRCDELLATAANVPEALDDETARKVADFVKSIAAHLKALEGARVAEKEDFLAGSRVVDGIFKTLSDPLKKAKETLDEKLGVVRRAREKREREAAEAKAAAERREAEERRRLAEEAAARDREAAAEARRQAEAAEAKQREAAAQRQREREEQERVARETAELAAREIAEAEARRKAADEAAEASKRARAKAEKEAREAEERAIEAAKAADKAERDRREAERVRRENEREENRKRAEAEREAREAERTAARAGREVDRAIKVEDAAEAREKRVENAKPSEFGAIRGDYGALVTLAQRWTFANIDRATLDLESLRPHLREADLEAAIRSYIDAGGRKLAGVDIFEDLKNRTI